MGISMDNHSNQCFTYATYKTCFFSQIRYIFFIVRKWVEYFDPYVFKILGVLKRD